MTEHEEVYADTLNILGSTPHNDRIVQDLVDQEHALADPSFKVVLEGRRKTPAVVTA